MGAFPMQNSGRTSFRKYEGSTVPPGRESGRAGGRDGGGPSRAAVLWDGVGSVAHTLISGDSPSLVQSAEVSLTRRPPHTSHLEFFEWFDCSQPARSSLSPFSPHLHIQLLLLILLFHLFFHSTLDSRYQGFITLADNQVPVTFAF